VTVSDLVEIIGLLTENNQSVLPARLHYLKRVITTIK